jgi:hypothetical protein
MTNKDKTKDKFKEEEGKEENKKEKEKKEDLNNLKKDYLVLEKKYNLPSFERLNEDFQIEKIDGTETDMLLREVRKHIVDKFSNYLRFIETLLNPSNAPLFVYSLVKTLTNEDRNTLNDLYKRMARSEVKIVKLDLSYSEKNESEFIKETYELWQDVKKNLMAILNIIEERWDNKSEGNNKGYFG